MKLSIAFVAALVVVGALALMAASAQPAPASAINLHDDAATIAAADAAKHEVLRRQQETARIAQMTRSAIVEATRQEQARVAQETQTARDARATQQQLYIQATATEQAIISRTLALSATAAALAIVDQQATQVAQAVEAERVAQAQAAEAMRLENEAIQRRVVLQQVGVILLFAFGFALFIATMRGLWKIGRQARPRHPASESTPAAASPPDEQMPKEPEVLIVDDAQFAETLAEMWKNQEPIR